MPATTESRLSETRPRRHERRRSRPRRLRPPTARRRGRQPSSAAAPRARPRRGGRCARRSRRARSRGSRRPRAGRSRPSRRSAARARPPRSASQHLLDEERIALGAGEHRVCARPRARPPRRGARRRAAVASAAVSGARVRARRVLLARAPGRAGPRAARGRAVQTSSTRVSASVLRELLQEVEQRARGPVDVLDHEDGELLAAERSTYRCQASSSAGATYSRSDRDDRRAGQRSPIVQASASTTRSALALGHDRLDRSPQLRERDVRRGRCRGSPRGPWPPRRAASR